MSRSPKQILSCPKTGSTVIKLILRNFLRPNIYTKLDEHNYHSEEKD